MDYIKIKQHDAILNMLRNLNNLRKDYEEYGANKIKFSTDKVDIIVDNEDETIQNDILNKLRYCNLKKIILYIMYRLSKDEYDNVHFDINEFLKLQNKSTQTNNANTVLENLNLLKNLKVDIKKANINGEKNPQLHLSNIIRKKEKQYRDRIIYIDTSHWGENLSKLNQFTIAPSEIFELDKLHLEIALSILIRLRNQRSTMKPKDDTDFALKVDSILKGVDIPNKEKYGAKKSISEIHNCLKNLEEDRNWFNFEYRGDDSISNLPNYRVLRSYRDYVVDFDIKDNKLYETIYYKQKSA